MYRGRYGGAYLLLVVASIALLALVAVADESEATVTGTPIPSSGDWIIDQDTVATGENIRLDGYIYVQNPWTLSLNGCMLTFDNVNPGWNGIYVDWSATLYINETSRPAIVRATAGHEDWFFQSDGDVYLDGAQIEDVYYSVYNFGYMYIEDSSIEINGNYGIYSWDADLHVGNSSIELTSPGNLFTMRTYGIYIVYGSASLYNIDLTVNIDMDDTYNTSSYNGYAYTYGIYAEHADIGGLFHDLGKEFKITMDIDIAVHNYYDTSYVYMYQRFYTRAIYLLGRTECTEIKDITLSISESFHGAIYNATSYGYVNVYNQQQYIYSQINVQGLAPLEISGLTFEDLGVQVTTGGVVEEPRIYYYNNAMWLYDAVNSRPTDTLTKIHDITVSGSSYDLVMYMPRYGEWELYDCTFEDLVVRRLINYDNGDSDYSISSNSFSSIMMMETYNTDLIYINRPIGEGTILNNNFTQIDVWRILYINYPLDRIYFQYNTFQDITQMENVYEPLIYFYDTQDKVTFTENTFDTVYLAEGLLRLRYMRDKVVFTHNTVFDSHFGSYLLRTEASDADVDISFNDLYDNEGPMFWFEYNYDRLMFTDNNISRNDAGAGYMIYTMRTYGPLKFVDNLFTGNSADGAMIYFKGATYFTSAAFFSFDRNILKDNTASSALNGGLVVFKGIRYDLAVKRNTFVNNVGNCFNFYRPYSQNNWYGYYFTVDGNEFRGNDGAATLWVDFRGYRVVVKRNIGTNNTGPLIRHVLTAYYIDDGDYPRAMGNMQGPLSFAVDSNNYSYNKGGAVDIRAQWADAWTPYSNVNQGITLLNNDFRYNGDGYSIKIVDFGPFPTMNNNKVLGSAYGIYLDAIDYPAIFERTTLKIHDMVYDGGGPNGMNAWTLIDVDAVFEDCSFTNYQETLFARDCQIDVYWSAIPEASGRTEGRGYIYVYNNMEILITWANAMGMDSGEPAVGASLAMLGTNGNYYGALETDKMGRIGPLLIMPWSSIEGRMDAWSPYAGTILAGGLTSHHTIHAIGEQVGVDSVHLIIEDTVVPDVVVTSPSMDAMSNEADMPLRGFLFETGSGIASFIGYLDGGEGVDVDPEQEWSAMFPGLEQGQHTIFFETIDAAGNMANTTISFFIDAVAPSLDLIHPKEGDVTRISTLVVQGTYQDDVSEISEIAVNVNGVTIGTTTGVINFPLTLTEGVNTVTVTATDKAGNTQAVLRTVTLDTYAPTLYVYTPLDALVTSVILQQVDGLSEAGTSVMIEQVMGEDVIFSTDVKADIEGIFVTVLFLEEGLQHIIVTAEDEAGNVRTITRTVTLDTTPPALFIDSPAPNSYINTPSVEVVGHIGDDPEGVIIRINGLEVEHSGVFSKSVPLAEGHNTIIVTATDPVMNVATRTINLTRDTIPPAQDMTNPNFILTNERMLEVRGKVNADAETVIVAGVTVNVEEDGSFVHTVDLSNEDGRINVIATDKADNQVVYTILYVFDDEKPTLTLTDVPQADTNKLVMYLNGTVTDNEATILFMTIRGDLYPVVNSKFSVLLTVETGGNGWNNFTVSATDNAGNVAIQKVSTQYVPEDVTVTDDDEEGILNSDLVYIGLLFIIAAVVLFMTVFMFKKRGDQS